MHPGGQVINPLDFVIASGYYPLPDQAQALLECVLYFIQL
jgi:hypothetical protein